MHIKWTLILQNRCWTKMKTLFDPFTHVRITRLLWKDWLFVDVLDLPSNNNNAFWENTEKHNNASKMLRYLLLHNISIIPIVCTFRTIYLSYELDWLLSTINRRYHFGCNEVWRGTWYFKFKFFWVMSQNNIFHSNKV